jgi:hypothetical protein
MTGSDKKRRDAISRLANALVEDILTASDQELLAEFAETHGDSTKSTDATRALFEKSVLNAKKARLRAAHACVAASRVAPATAKVVSMEDARGRLRRLVASCPPDLKLTLAARNEDELSDADVLGMLQDFEELGIVPPGDESGGRP